MSRTGRQPSISASSIISARRDPSPDLPELHKLVKNGNVAGVQAYLDRRADEREDINILDHKSRTALHHACLCVINTSEMVLLLLRRGAYVHAVTDKNYLTPLHCACVKGSLDAIRLLLKYGADLNSMTADGKTPFKMLPPTGENKKFVKAILKPPPSPKFSKKDKELLEACTMGNESRVLDLLDKYVDINVFDEKTGLTALMMAARQGHEAIAHLLLLHFADVHKQDLGKNTVMHWACARGNPNITRMLCYYNASVNISDRDHNYTPMHWAAAKCHRELISILLRHHANPNLPDRDGMTPLHIACRLGHLSMVEELVSHIEVQINLGDSYGVRPIHMAVRRSDVKIVQMLITKGHADVTAETITGNTPLHDACEEPNPVIAKSLLEAGAKPVVNAKNVEGNTPLHITVNALRKADARLTKYILKTINLLTHYGANPNIKNNEGKIPMLLVDPIRAMNEGTPENFVVKALIDGGVDLTYIQQSSTLRNRSQQERAAFQEVIEAIQAQSDAQPLPEGWTRSVQNGRRIYIDSSGNKTAVSPQLWMLANDPRLNDNSGTMEMYQGPKPSMLSLADVTCGYCNEILYKPVTTDCGHNFCQICLDLLLRKSANCTVCKKKIPKKEHVVNSMFSTIVERSFPERYAARVAELRSGPR